ncbi:hypothetical protein B0J11DRAFT_99399 [Dendryphion nanum]|uniref:Uncharacterized protein n=1 Tax=Dendryphion nanum TaxID=256645 RepID=A0A9P9DCH7_9PLEO|nr:hypothetical protein B0J11DRAFT_99399 [Dendryphion nanum]
MAISGETPQSCAALIAIVLDYTLVPCGVSHAAWTHSPRVSTCHSGLCLLCLLSPPSSCSSVTQNSAQVRTLVVTTSSLFTAYTEEPCRPTRRIPTQQQGQAVTEDQVHRPGGLIDSGEAEPLYPWCNRLFKAHRFSLVVADCSKAGYWGLHTRRAIGAV